MGFCAAVLDGVLDDDAAVCAAFFEEVRVGGVVGDVIGEAVELAIGFNFGLDLFLEFVGLRAGIAAGLNRDGRP